MGEVYRAQDTRLNRTVALKVLPSLKASPEFRQRFEREARAIAGLNHPHICTLHDVRNESGVDLLVMEFCDGITLAERLNRGRLTVDQVTRYGIEIAEALDHAHRHGLTHRDLKPGNVMLTPSGVKLLDFGLAKLAEHDVAAAAPGAADVTETLEVTRVGTVVGTRPYMAPEQLEGKSVDARADIFAFGAVLYEMLTGKRAFESNSGLGIMAAILSPDPVPVAPLQSIAPAPLVRIISHCLSKDPDDRWSSMQDVLFALRGIREDIAAGGEKTQSLRAARYRAVAGATTLALALVGIAAWQFWPRPAARVDLPLIRFPVYAPESATWAASDGPVVSPDGRRFAFTATLPDGRSLLWVRLQDALSAQPLSGTEGASDPFWSPDSRFIGFFADGHLKAIDVSGGSPTVVCPAPYGGSGTWNARGVILFARSTRDALYQVSAKGGVPVQVSALDPSRGDWGHRTPSFLPDGEHFFYVVRSAQKDRDGVYVGDLSGGQSPRLLPNDSTVLFRPPGHALYLQSGTLVAQPFDPVARAFTGPAIPIAHPVGSDVATSQAFFSASDTGVLTYRGHGDTPTQLAWFDRRGRKLGQIGPPGFYWDLALSPNEQFVAMTRLDPLTATRDVWTIELARDRPSQLTFSAADEFLPAWLDDDRIIHSAREGSNHHLLRRPATAGGRDDGLATSTTTEMMITDISRDGRYGLYSHIDRSQMSRSDIFLLSLADRQARKLIQTRYRETQARFSPDGQWVAYSSDESGRPEVYVAGVSTPDSRLPLTSGGGSHPTWRRDGRELFYLDLQGRLIAVPLGPGPAFQPDTPRVLFQTELPQVSQSAAGADYAVTADGSRVIIKTPAQRPDQSPITVFLNWTGMLGQ